MLMHEPQADPLTRLQARTMHVCTAGRRNGAYDVTAMANHYVGMSNSQQVPSTADSTSTRVRSYMSAIT